MDEERVQKHLKWVKENVPRIEYGDKFTEKTLELQVRSYLALKDMAAEQSGNRYITWFGDKLDGCTTCFSEDMRH